MMKKLYTGLLISLMTCSLTAQTFTEISETPFDTISGPAAFADIDNDNDQDVMIGSRIYKNDGNGNFEYESGWAMEKVTSIAFADIDNDNDQDLLISWYYTSWEFEFTISFQIDLYTNNGSGIFSGVPNTPFIVGGFGTINFEDVDNDNDQDVLITGYTYYDWSIWGGGSSNPESTLYLNDGNGNYSVAANNPFIGVGGGAVAFTDIDNDNDQDVLITGNSCLWSAWCIEPLSTLYINDGNGNFTQDSNNSLVSVSASGVAFADIDNDNDQDVIISGLITFDEGTAKIYANDGNGNFTESLLTPFDAIGRSSVAFADVDNDNDQDVLITGNNGSESIAKLFTNDGNGNFTEKAETPFEGVENGTIAFADIDNDNDQDVLISGKNNSNEDIVELYENSSSANANTCYYGEQTIITDSVAPGIYHLVDNTRGGGIETYNLQNTINFGSQIHFVDDDNYWECEAPNNGAADAHFGMEMFYDFFLTKYNRNSFDGNGAKMVSLVHMGNNNPAGVFLELYACFGDGPGNAEPKTRIEHVGHEFTHGIINHSAGLENSNEQGALSESFGNILGTAVEFWAAPEYASWMFNTVGSLGYNMADPKTSTSPVGTHYPDTYHGQYWLFSGPQIAITHINCSVQDYWYYLLSEGGSGTNDNGDVYTVDAIGIESATDIVYRNLTVHVTPTSSYIDARQGSIQSAIDLYGDCSLEVEQVINAWYAVGIGPEDYNQDLSLSSIVSPANKCGLSDEEFVEVEVLYNVSGCSDIILSGSEIEMTYQFGNNSPVIETWILDQDFEEGETLNYIFSQPINLPDIGEEHELNVWVDFASDDFVMNNMIEDFKVERKFDFDGSNMGFEFASSVDSFYTKAGDYTKAVIDTVAKNTGDYGIQMTVTNRFDGPGTFADDPSLNFEQQTHLISEVCFCVDATDWDNVSLYFDMKQTHSMFYMYWWGSDSTEFVSSMRMLINGEQFGEQFHPDTYTDDPYLTYNYDLSQLAGTYFEFCFQSKNYQDDLNDNSIFFPYDTDGDNTYLDNIRFVDQLFTGVKESETNDFTIYPNPANDEIFIDTDKGVLISEINIFNQVGQKVLHNTNPANPLDISTIGKGLYIIEIVSDEITVLEKLIVR